MPWTYASWLTAVSALVRHAARLQEAEEIAALPELGDAQFDDPGPVAAATWSAISFSAAKRIISRRRSAIMSLVIGMPSS